jgi:hypothetical protein
MRADETGTRIRVDPRDPRCTNPRCAAVTARGYSITGAGRSLPRGHRPRLQQRTVAGGADPGRFVEGLALNVERAENVSVAGRGEAGRFMEGTGVSVAAPG